jgi:hypothetical protein
MVGAVGIKLLKIMNVRLWQVPMNARGADAVALGRGASKFGAVVGEQQKLNQRHVAMNWARRGTQAAGTGLPLCDSASRA